MQSLTKIFILFILLFFFWALFVQNDLAKNRPNFDELDDLLESSNRLERILKHEKDQIELMEKRINDLQKLSQNDFSMGLLQEKIPNSLKKWKDPIPVLVFSCNRATAVREHIKKLIKYRPNKEKFPIIVTQDCDNDAVKDEVDKFGAEIEYIKHIAGDKANITIPLSHQMYTAYYRIARHYKLALDYVFNTKKHTSVIITEDDLDISPDFFVYFSSTRYLMEHDKLLWCVSAWNDNGKIQNIDTKAYAQLYRSDFFPGLGWMMTSDTWSQIGPIWPSGFWDDWMRDPLRRENRQCIRPEISRTGMTNFGKEGASKGQFFTKHLAKIVVNQKYTDFDKLDLDYLLPKNYAKVFEDQISKATLLDIDEITQFVLESENKGKSVKILYEGNIDYIEKADKLHIMHDFKAGVPRTAYNGVVTCFINGVRIYLIPNREKVSGYDPNWSVPLAFGE